MKIIWLRLTEMRLRFFWNFIVCCECHLKTPSTHVFDTDTHKQRIESNHLIEMEHDFQAIVIFLVTHPFVRLFGNTGLRACSFSYDRNTRPIQIPANKLWQCQFLHFIFPDDLAFATIWLLLQSIAEIHIEWCFPSLSRRLTPKPLHIIRAFWTKWFTFRGLSMLFTVVSHLFNQ